MPRNNIIIIFLLSGALSLSSCTDNDKRSDNNTTTDIPQRNTNFIPYTLIKTLPHDTVAFTEGLCWHKGKLYESTGSPDELPQTKSYFGVVDTASGKVQQKHEIDRKVFFGEGIAIIGDSLFQLTYKNRKGFVYNLHTMKKMGEFNFYNQEGWGLTTDGQSLIMTDGTSNITYMDPKTYKAFKVIPVTDNGNYIVNLNELEYIDGWLFANVYGTNYIVKINPENGAVVGKLDLNALAKKAKDEYPKALEMNGIAYKAETKSIYITGKMWPRIFEIKIN